MLWTLRCGICVFLPRLSGFFSDFILKVSVFRVQDKPIHAYLAHSRGHLSEDGPCLWSLADGPAASQSPGPLKLNLCVFEQMHGSLIKEDGGLLRIPVSPTGRVLYTGQ